MSDVANEGSARTLQVPRGSARVEPILCLPDLLREWDASAEEVFANAGVPMSILESADNSLSYESYGRLLIAAVAATRCTHFGLLLGAKTSLSRLGLVGMLAANASDVGTALNDLVERIPRFNRAVTVSLAESEGTATFGYDLLEPNIPGGELIRESGVAIASRVLRELCGPSWTPEVVTFPHKARGPTGPYVEFFRAPVVFNSASAGLVFSGRVLRQPMSLASQAVRDALKGRLDRLGSVGSDTFSDRVRRQIHVAIARGQLGESAIARSLGMDTSTLRRKLAQEGAKYRTIAQRVKFGVASQLINETDLKLADVAAVIGFDEKSVFTRAFRQWSGMTPSQWRERAKGSSLR